MVATPPVSEGRAPFLGRERRVISLRKMTLGSGYHYLMESVAAGDGVRRQSTTLSDYYAESGTPPGVFLGAGLRSLNGGLGVEKGSVVSEEHLFNMLGMCADPVSGQPLGRQPNRAHLSLAKRVAERTQAVLLSPGTADRAEQVGRIETEEREAGMRFRAPVAGFDLTFSPSKSISTAWALANAATKGVIYDCHRKAIEVVVTYAEREVFRSRSGTGGVVQEDIEGVVAAAFTHWDSRSGDPQLHDHVVISNRARSVSDGAWRTLDGRAIFKNVVALSELHQGVLSDLLTHSLGWGWDGRSRFHSDQLRYEVTGISEALMAEFSSRSASIELRKNDLVAAYAGAHGHQPGDVAVLKLRQQATLETRPAKQHRSLDELSGQWRDRAERYVGAEGGSWVAELENRNDLPLLHVGDLDDEILDDAATVAVRTVAERRATFTRSNLLAELHRQFQGVRFASPEDRIAVVDRSADLATAQSLVISAPELHHTPERFRRPDGTTRFRAKGHEIYTTATLLEAESRLLETGKRIDGPATTLGTVAVVTGSILCGRDHMLGPDQAGVIRQIATSGRSLDLLVGSAGTGKSTTMAGLRAVWERQYGPGSVRGLAPSAAAAEVSAGELGIETENIAKWLFEHRRTLDHRKATAPEVERARWRLRKGQLVIVDEASLAGTFALAELVTAAERAGAKILLSGDHAQLSAVEAGGMFGALVRDRGDLVAELTDVRRFRHDWEKRASVALRVGSSDAIDDYQAHERIASGTRDEMLDALYGAWKGDIEAGALSLMIAGDLGTVSELNARARADRVTAGHVAQDGVPVAGGATASVGDQVVTRHNDRRLTTGRRWVRNGDTWTVTGVDPDGSMTVSRIEGGSRVVLPVAYVTEHVELAYATTAHRAQGRTVDTAHAMVSPTTTREVLYVMVTRGREVNNLYVDTHYDPDPETSHGQTGEPRTARDVLIGALRNEGADAAAHDMMRRQQGEAEGMERLSAEYLTLATAAQAERWDTLLAGAGFAEPELESVRSSEALGQLTASLRRAEARRLDVDAALPTLVSGRAFDSAGNIAETVAARLDRWTEAAGSKRRSSDDYVVGLIPRARSITDPDMARALAERDRAMQARAHVVAIDALESGQPWAKALGAIPEDPERRARWVHEILTVAAYRDRWHITGSETIGRAVDGVSTEQAVQRRLAESAALRARAVSDGARRGPQRYDRAPQMGVERGVEL
jgi:conjugative relaxase-like TrwC/TraI family protein